MQREILLSAVGFLVHSPLGRAQMSCLDHANAAIGIAKPAGQTLSCCDSATTDCHVQHGAAGCDSSTHESWVYCLRAGDAQACTVSQGLDVDLPCGKYSGRPGHELGISPVASGYAIPLLSPDVQKILESNWNWLLGHSLAVLCCSATGVINAPAPHTAQASNVSHNPCYVREYALRCFGTTTRGLCSAYDNKLVTSEIGQYYIVNFELDTEGPSESEGNSLPTSTVGNGRTASETGTSEATASETGTFEVTVSRGTTSLSTTSALNDETRSPRRAVERLRNNPEVIAAPVAGVLLILGLVALFFWMRHLAKTRAEKTSITPYVGTPAVPSIPCADPGHKRHKSPARLTEHDVRSGVSQQNDFSPAFPGTREQEAQLPSYSRS